MNPVEITVEDMLPKAKGRILTNLARLYGIQRKWLGLEPDFMLRKRILKAAVGVEARTYWYWGV